MSRDLKFLSGKQPNQLRRSMLKSMGQTTVAASVLNHFILAPAFAQKSAGRVVVVGGGFGGATAAKYLKLRNSALDVTLVEPSTTYYTCPFSNMYLGGLRQYEQLAQNYNALRAMGVQVIHESATDVDVTTKSLKLSSGKAIVYDKLVLSPGIDFRWNTLSGYDQAASELAPHAWKAGAQTVLLKKQLTDMPDGGVFIMSVPDNPYRCPPGPYERVGMIAHYFKAYKPKSKILILDAKDVFSKQSLFMDGWKQYYGDMIEWIPLSKDGKVVRVDAKNLSVETEFGQVHKAAVLNVIPPQKAGLIAERAGVLTNSGWASVKPQTFESALVPDVFVVGDATIANPMPKSGFAANVQAKVVAAAIVNALAGRAPDPAKYANTCYSLIAPDYGISITGVYEVAGGKLAEVKGAGGVSPKSADASFRKREADYGDAWYNAITRDTWG